MSIMAGITAGPSGRSGPAVKRWLAAQSYDVHKAAQDRATPQSILQDIAANGPVRLAAVVASNKGASDETLRIALENRPNSDILERIAANKNASADTLSRLLDLTLKSWSWNALIVAKVLRNPRISAADVARIASIDPLLVSGLSAKTR